MLGTLDPRIPGLGAWEPVSLAGGGDSALTIDLSNLSFAGEPAPASASLSDRELAELMDAISEAEAEGWTDDSGELSDAELADLMAAAEGDAVRYNEDFTDAAADFDAAFSARAQADADRADAISAALVEDTLHPARRSEDKLARIMHRAAQGVYSGQQADFSAEQAGVEILLANGGHGPCGPLDDFGRCSSRYHELGCAHDQATDWLASGPPRSTYDASLANFATGLAIDLATRQVWDDPDDYDQAPVYMPQQTVELASSLADEWGLHGDAWSGPSETDLLRAPGAPITMADALYQEMGYESAPAERPVYPGISDIRARMGL